MTLHHCIAYFNIICTSISFILFKSYLILNKCIRLLLVILLKTSVQKSLVLLKIFQEDCSENNAQECTILVETSYDKFEDTSNDALENITLWAQNMSTDLNIYIILKSAVAAISMRGLNCWFGLASIGVHWRVFRPQLQKNVFKSVTLDRPVDQINTDCWTVNIWIFPAVYPNSLGFPLGFHEIRLIRYEFCNSLQLARFAKKWHVCYPVVWYICIVS